jgi:hypothetical protein
MVVAQEKLRAAQARAGTSRTGDPTGLRQSLHGAQKRCNNEHAISLSETAVTSTGGESRVSSTLPAFAVLEHIAAAEESPTLEGLTRAIGLP